MAQAQSAVTVALFAEPGTTTATIKQRTAAEPAALTASVTVETSDDQVRNISRIALHGTQWLETRREGCADPA